MADPTTDHRADLYALGVVGYEMLAGQPPFSGRTSQHLIAAHATETPVPLEQRRPDAPAGVSRLILRLLHKRPSDRPQTADEVLAALESAGSPAETTVAARHEVSRRGRWLAAGGLVVGALALLLAWLGGRHRSVTTDRRVVAIAPFRVTGADSSLGYLREGMVDLLATKLGGTANLRPADPPEPCSVPGLELRAEHGTFRRLMPCGSLVRPAPGAWSRAKSSAPASG